MIYHITTQLQWAHYKVTGKIEAESLEKEGFIHCSTKEQVAQVASFYFTGRKDLVLLEINEERLNSELKWEGSDDKENSPKFPHVYGPIAISCVEREVMWAANENGEFEFPFKTTLH